MLKKNIIVSGCETALGAVFLVLARVLHTDNGYIVPLGAAFLLIGGLMLVKFLRLRHDPERRKAYEISATEERTVYIVQKTASITLFITILAEAAGVIAAMLLNKSAVVDVLSPVLCLQLVVRMVVGRLVEMKS